jgi:hypothetical protein
MLMAENEVYSHCELLCAAGDVRPAEDEGFLLTGSEGYESAIHALEPE